MADVEEVALESGGKMQSGAMFPDIEKHFLYDIPGTLFVEQQTGISHQSWVIFPDQPVESLLSAPGQSF